MSIIEIIIIFTLVLAIFLAGTLIGAAKREYDVHCEMEENETKANDKTKPTDIKR